MPAVTSIAQRDVAHARAVRPRIGCRALGNSLLDGLVAGTKSSVDERDVEARAIDHLAEKNPELRAELGGNPRCGLVEDTATGAKNPSGSSKTGFGQTPADVTFP